MLVSLICLALAVIILSVHVAWLTYSLNRTIQRSRWMTRAFSYGLRDAFECIRRINTSEVAARALLIEKGLITRDEFQITSLRITQQTDQIEAAAHSAIEKCMEGVTLDNLHEHDIHKLIEDALGQGEFPGGKQKEQGEGDEPGEAEASE